MNGLAHISDVTTETFQAAVLERSMQLPVLVDYWAEWCGPCEMQLPVLTKLAEEYAGGFELAKINADEQQGLAREQGIHSLPTLRLYAKGEIVEEVLGAQTEAGLRALLERYITRESDELPDKALQLRLEGRTDEARDMLQDALKREPGNHRLATALADIAIGEGQLSHARALLESLPADVREQPENVRLDALLFFANIARDARPAAELETALADRPDDMETRYQLAAQHVLENQPEKALNIYMDMIARDRSWGDDAGRKCMLAVFNLLGNEGELVSSYRRRLFNAIT